MEDNRSLKPDTTAEQDIVTKGQRRINLIWETTQAIIAIGITGATIYNAVIGIKSDVLNNAFFLVIAMYFVRTNHKLTGGVGAKSATESR